jgi:hypothetical protein
VYGAIAGFSLTEVTRRNLDSLDDEPDEEYDEWEGFLTDEAAADLSDDIYSVDILSEDWKGTYPWDDENRDMYCTWRTKSLWSGTGKSRYWPREKSRVLRAGFRRALLS